jgi:hypothetical protein
MEGLPAVPTDGAWISVPRTTPAWGRASVMEVNVGSIARGDITLQVSMETDTTVETTTTQDAATEETYTNQNSKRDALMQDLYDRMNSSKQNGNQALKNQNGDGMLAATEQMAVVIQDIQVAEVELRKEEKAEEKTKEKQQQYNKLLNDAVMTMKIWKGNTAKVKNWQMIEGGEKKIAQESFKKELDSLFMDSLRKNAEVETQKNNDVAKEKVSVLNMIFSGRKDASGNPIKEQRLSKEEIAKMAKEAHEDGFDGIEGVMKNLSPKDRQEIRKTVKDYQKVSDTAEAKKVKEAKLSNDEKKVKDGETKVAEDVADVHAENNGVKAPTTQEMKSTYAAFLEKGKISEVDYKILMEKLQKKDAARKMNGASLMAAADDDQAQSLQYNAYRAQFLDNQEVDGDGSARANNENAFTFERFTFGMQNAVEGGYGYKAAERASFKAISSTKTFDGEVEKGLFNLNTQVYKNTAPEVVESNEDDAYTHNREVLKKKAEDKGYVHARAFQTADPDSVV